MTDKEIIAVAALLASNDIHQNAIANLLAEKGIITKDELQARINVLIEEKFETGIESYQKVIRNMTKHE